MRAQGNTLLLVTVVAALIAASTGSAGAQKRISREGVQNFHVSKPQRFTQPGRDGGRRHWHHDGWHGPGIVVAIPPSPEIIDDRPDEYAVHGPRRPRQRTTTAPRGPSGAPPTNERRFLPDEVVIEVANSVSAAQIDALQRHFRLTRIESRTFQLTGRRLFRWRIPDGRPVTSVVRALAGNALVAAAQPNYLFAPQAHTIAKK
jgi:hypothetical protein